ncbi:hypothetical protein HHK36_019776 [Tetracentron sinense]|uniref:NAC domain-containing protein n=1 Tax=Tetracentron sinense TaxID=13715 RepID=A0A835DCL0_TETSI|nr:hypothetical protein HHK36_019776 [Tetracentron sinense]
MEQQKKKQCYGFGVSVDKSAEDDKYFDMIPPGYRFCPKDSELILDYLKEKVMNHPLPPNRIKEVNLKDYSPQDLIEKYYCKAYGEKEWYFFTPRDRKYLKGDRPDRAAGDGFWRATEAKKPVCSNGGTLVGYKRSSHDDSTVLLVSEQADPFPEQSVLQHNHQGFDELPQHNFAEPDQVSAYRPFDQSFGHSMAQNWISCFHTSMTNMNSSNQPSLPFVGEQLPASSMPSSAQYLDNQQGTTQLFSLPFISTQLPASSMPSSVKILENQQSTSQLSSIQSIVDYLQNPKSLEDNLSFSSEDYSITSVGAADLDVGCIDTDCSSSEEFLMDWDSVIPSSTLTQQQPSPPLAQQPSPRHRLSHRPGILNMEQQKKKQYSLATATAIKATQQLSSTQAKGGIKTNWLMQEYRSVEAIADHDNPPTSINGANDMRMRTKFVHTYFLDGWVLCKIYNKKLLEEESGLPPRFDEDMVASEQPDPSSEALPELINDCPFDQSTLPLHCSLLDSPLDGPPSPSSIQAMDNQLSTSQPSSIQFLDNLQQPNLIGDDDFSFLGIDR